MRGLKLGIVLVGLLGAASTVRAADYWGGWEPANDPKVLGDKVLDQLLPRPFPANYRTRGGMSYPEVCAAYGCVRFVGETQDKERFNKLVTRYEVFFTDAGKPLITQPISVDDSVFGILPLEIFRLKTGKSALGGGGGGGAAEDPLNQRWLSLGLSHADGEWESPRPDGLTKLTRFWVDDMFMITALQVEAFRATGDKKYLDRTANEMVAYLDKLQKPNGLFYHGEDSPFFWSRGNGWMAAGMAEILSVMPADHPQRKAIMDGYQKMMAGLVKYQGKDGMWKQLIDKEDSWAETSGTGMFTFSMAMGVRNGWLDEKTYKEPALKAWKALATYLNPDGQVREVCEGTNKGTSVEYYETRKRNVGDFHGQAAFIWAAWAMDREPVKP